MARQFSLNCEVHFDLPSPDDLEREFTVSVDTYYPGEAPSRDSPGDGPEVTTEPFVEVARHNLEGRCTRAAFGPTRDVITWDDFVREYAIAHKVTLDKAESLIYDKVLDKACDAASERDDYDGPEDFDRYYDR